MLRGIEIVGLLQVKCSRINVEKDRLYAGSVVRLHGTANVSSL